MLPFAVDMAGFNGTWDLYSHTMNDICLLSPRTLEKWLAWYNSEQKILLADRPTCSRVDQNAEMARARATTPLLAMPPYHPKMPGEWVAQTFILMVSFYSDLFPVKACTKSATCMKIKNQFKRRKGDIRRTIGSGVTCLLSKNVGRRWHSSTSASCSTSIQKLKTLRTPQWNSRFAARKIIRAKVLVATKNRSTPIIKTPGPRISREINIRTILRNRGKNRSFICSSVAEDGLYPEEGCLN